ncbi:MAG: DUF983 domain-containing protein [Dichotomicrobium sp.]
MTSATPAINGLLGRCPRCGQGRLFTRFLQMLPACRDCGLDFGFADAGDGPAVFVSFFAGFIVCGGAVLTELVYQPPYWVHAVIWGPLAVLIPLAMLRPSKGLLIGLQYRHGAREGRETGA